MDTLLRTQCFVYGVPDSAIATTLAVNVGDGGVDTRIDEGTANDRTGYLDLPTAWQFKAESADRLTEASVVREIQKPYATDLVRAGFGYRLGVACDLTPKRKEQLVRALNEAARAICPDARPCHLLTASDLAEWANRFPGLVASVFDRPTTIARHGQAWMASQTAVTPHYVPPAGAEDRLRAIQTHLQSSHAPLDPVLPVLGAAGVGKTRLAFEAICRLPGALSLVVVTNDDRRAQEAAQWLVNSGSLSAILVADECSIQARFELNNLVRGHEARVRVIAIDNTGEPPPHGAPGVWVEKIEPGTAEQILHKNFPVVPTERRRAYADLCGGYIRLAADLCRYDPQMHEAGSLQPAMPTLEEYYQRRLAPEDQRVVQALALVHRIGHTEDVAGQLTMLAELTGITPEDARRTAARLKDAPGFIVVTPRYYYVTPQIIAEIAFRRVWRERGAPNPAGFLDRMPEPLRSAFELRIRGLAEPQVRSIVSAHFRQRVADLTSADLADSVKVAPLLGLLENDPTAYLPQLTRLVRDASETELLAINGAGAGVRGTRRELVWSAERVAIFPEYFSDAEFILRRLALAETELGIGNNATGIWRQMFRVYLSGASVPFRDRFTVFRGLLLSDNPRERDLALGAFNHLIDTYATRMGTPAVVSGRIPPADWRPQTQAEFEDCFSLVTGLAEDLLTRPEPLFGAGWGFFLTHLRIFLAWGKLELLRSVVERQPVPDRWLGPWLEEVDDFLQYEGGDREKAPPQDREYCDRVRSWQCSMLPADFTGRLRGIVGKDLWHHSIREDLHKQESEIGPLVDEVAVRPELLEANLGYLCSPEARSASTFGVLLGRRDRPGLFLNCILTASQETHSTALLRGYVGGLLQAHPEHIRRISQVLDDLEHNHPEVAAEIIVSSLDVTDPVTRLTRMVSTGKLNPLYLRYLHYGHVIQQTPSGQFAGVLGAVAGPDSKVESLKTAVELIGDRWQGVETIREQPETLDDIKAVLRRSAVTEDRADFWWRTAMERLAYIDPQWTVEVAVTAASGDAYQKRDDANAILVRLAAERPESVMEAVGAALLDRHLGWRWSIGSNREFISALPVEVVMNWLSRVGVEGARRLARHLSSPTVSAHGSAVVPELTERVLEAYGDDQEVFSQFAVGRHDLEASRGPISSHHEGHARIARAFLNHRLPVIRKWAEHELADAEHFAGIWRRREEDEGWNS
jgi:hypothetical protein